MIKINKLPETPGLRKYKEEISIENQSYESGSDCFVNYRKCEDGNTEFCYTSPESETAFIELRKQLLREQKFVCAYCNNEIKAAFNANRLPQMKTEHFVPKNGKNANKALELEYSNLLAVCLGNSDSKAKNHCDSSKDDNPLVFIQNPANENFESLFEYQVLNNQKRVLIYPKTGQSNHEEIYREIDKILNLNEIKLKEKRYTDLNNYVLKKIENKISIDYIDNLIQEYTNPNNEKSIPFLDCIIYYLREERNRLTSIM